MAINFKKATKTIVEITVKGEYLQAESAKDHLQSIAENFTLEELSIVAKLSRNTLVKPIALQKAKEYL
jgi:hypothetical protein